MEVQGNRKESRAERRVNKRVYLKVFVIVMSYGFLIYRESQNRIAYKLGGGYGAKLFFF